MEISRLAESSILVRNLNQSPILAAKKFRDGLTGLVDVVPCYTTVALYFDGDPPTKDALEYALSFDIQIEPAKRHRIPVNYAMGEDLDRVCSNLKLTVDGFIQIHSSHVYDCAAVGFTPGFAYLGDLDERIALTSRLPSPRVKVPAGSVAITGRQTAVYSTSSPGGWNFIGRTPLEMVNVAEDYFPISAGDSVEFFSIDDRQFSASMGKRL